MPIALTHPKLSRHVRRLRPARSRPTRPGQAMIVVGALSVVFLAGCGGGSTSTSTEASVNGAGTAQDSAGRDIAPGAASVPDANSAPGGKAATGVPNSPTGATDAAKPGTTTVGVGPKLSKNASLDLQVKEIAAAAARVRSIATSVQAQILSEQIGKGGPGDPMPLENGKSTSVTGDMGGFGTLTLSVPADRLDTALDRLSKDVGTVVRRNTSSQDVTAQYVDTESRLKTMRASVDRVRALMAQAKDIGQVVTLESEMSRRQADLESLESQQAALKTSVERATLSVSLTTPAAAIDAVSNNGFLAGLRAGWDAFTASASGLFTAIGATLPFAVFFALLAAPIAWWLRRRQTNRRVSPAPTSP